MTPPRASSHTMGEPVPLNGPPGEVEVATPMQRSPPSVGTNEANSTYDDALSRVTAGAHTSSSCAHDGAVPSASCPLVHATRSVDCMTCTSPKSPSVA